MKGRRSVLPKREEAEPPADIPLIRSCSLSSSRAQYIYPERHRHRKKHKYPQTDCEYRADLFRRQILQAIRIICSGILRIRWNRERQIP
jgi:hypothetical protein